MCLWFCLYSYANQQSNLNFINTFCCACLANSHGWQRKKCQQLSHWVHFYTVSFLTVNMDSKKTSKKGGTHLKMAPYFPQLKMLSQHNRKKFPWSASTQYSRLLSALLFQLISMVSVFSYAHLHISHYLHCVRRQILLMLYILNFPLFFLYRHHVFLTIFCFNTIILPLNTEPDGFL